MEIDALLASCRKEMAKAVVGQAALFDALMTALLSGAHLLLEGLPGLAKTTAAKTFATITGLSFRRVQFTPDLLPQDITGTLQYEAATGKFIARQGPIFANVVLADEINRAGAKVQSALLEAMQERQVTLGTETLVLPEPFIVIATENPIDEDGTYALPAAERDRFLMKEVVPYPTAEEECEILTGAFGTAVKAVLDADKVHELRTDFKGIACDDKLVRYIVEVVRATRPEQGKGDVSRYVAVGASPRGSIALLSCAKANAMLAGRNFVLPEDIKACAPRALRHRLTLKYEAASDNVTADSIIGIVLNTTPVP